MQKKVLILLGFLASIAVESTLGKVELLNQYPYQVAIEQYISGQWIFRCSGAIIDQSYVLTSAQCISKFSNLYRVIAGYWPIACGDNCRNMLPIIQVIPVVNITVHENYKPPNQCQRFWGTLPANDIALVRLCQPLLFNKFVSRVDLPKQDQCTKEYDIEPSKPYGQDCPEHGYGCSKKECKITRPCEKPCKSRCTCTSASCTTRSRCTTPSPCTTTTPCQTSTTPCSTTPACATTSNRCETPGRFSLNRLLFCASDNCKSCPRHYPDSCCNNGPVHCTHRPCVDTSCTTERPCTTRRPCTSVKPCTTQKPCTTTKSCSLFPSYIPEYCQAIFEEIPCYTKQCLERMRRFWNRLSNRVCGTRVFGWFRRDRCDKTNLLTLLNTWKRSYNHISITDDLIVLPQTCNYLLDKIVGVGNHPPPTKDFLCVIGPINMRSNSEYRQLGAPLLDPDNNFLAGLLSWVADPCDSFSGAPSLYTKVSKYVDWIHKHATGATYTTKCLPDTISCNIASLLPFYVLMN